MDTGGKIRTGKILEQLKNIFDITLVSNVESPKDDKYLQQINNLCAEFHPELLRSLFSRYPFTVLNDCSRDVEATLLRLTSEKRFDLLVCDFLQPSLNFRHLSGAPTLLFEHNIEAVIPRRHFETSRNLIAKMFWWLQWRRMERYEREACRAFTCTVTVSETDKTSLKEFGIENIFAIPTGVDTDYFAPREDQVKKNSLVFTGSMDWLPNEDAIQFFIRDILPRVKQQIPDVTLTVVGRNPSRRFLNEIKSHPEVTVTGRVDDVRSYMNCHTLYIIPLRIGGGTRIKAYEAMAMAKAVVSTRIGVEGLPVKHGDHVLIADEPQEFAAAVVRLLRNVDERKHLELNARTFVETRFSWETVAEVFARICWKVTEVTAVTPCAT